MKGRSNMGGGSNSSSSSTGSKTYKTTTTTNPYVTSTTNNKGTKTTLQPNTALSSIYNFTNSNVDKLLNEYLNPSIDSEQNQAQLNQFRKTLADETNKNLENNITVTINLSPLTRFPRLSNLTYDG